MGNKGTKRKKKLAARRRGWEDIGGTMVNPQTKRYGSNTYHKPGSLNPRK